MQLNNFLKRFLLVFVLSIMSFVLLACEEGNIDTEPSVPSEPTEVTSYSIQIENVSNGTVSTNKSQATQGELITINAQPNQGYEIDTVSVSQGTTQVTVTNLTFTMPNGNVLVQVTFKETTQPTYTVSITQNNGGEVTSNVSSAQAGATVILTITPDSNMAIDIISVLHGSTVITVSNNAFIMPEGNVIVTVTFKTLTIPTYTITIPDIDGVEIEIVNEGASFEAGTVIEVVLNLDLLYREKPNTLKYMIGSTSTFITNRTFIMPSNNITLSVEVEMITLPDVSSIILSVMDRPDPWTFLPESFALENKVYKGSPSMNYTSFVNVSAIPNTGIGKQMNILYDIMLDIENVMGYLDPIYQTANTLATAYQTFINENPDDYNNFTTTIAGVSVTIILDEGYNLTISYNDISLELYYINFEDGYIYGGRLFITEANVIKYEVTEDSFVIAARLFGTFRAHIEFTRDDDGVRGSLYHFVGVNEVGINTRALLHVGNTHTTIIGEKGDFLIQATTKRNVEVYDNQTGLMVGSEVKESVPIVGTYDTMWYPLGNLTGINNIKVIATANGNNANSIYINNKDTLFVTHNTLTGARQYDIELKTQYFYTFNATTDEYTKIELQIPMFFIWRAYEESTGYTQVNSRNSITVTNTTTATDKNAIYYGYDVLLPIYDTIRENMTPQAVIDYIAQN